MFVLFVSLFSFFVKYFLFLNSFSGVTYDVEGFVERNKDTMSPDVIQLMNESQSPLVQTLFASQAVPPGKGSF